MLELACEPLDFLPEFKDVSLRLLAALAGYSYVSNTSTSTRTQQVSCRAGHCEAPCLPGVNPVCRYGLVGSHKARQQPATVNPVRQPHTR